MAVQRCWTCLYTHLDVYKRQVANAVQFFDPQLGVFLLIISGFEEQCRDLLKAFLLGLGCKIGVLVACLCR